MSDVTWRIMLATLAAVVVVLPVAGAAPNDNLLVLDHRAGPYSYLNSFKRGRPGAYEAAVAAFGKATRFRASGNLCHITWRNAGVTVGIASRPRPCASANLRAGAWYGMSLHGRKWHNRRGIRVGDPVEKVRRLYPEARFDASRPSWLLLLRRRVDEFNFIRLAVAVSRQGRVTSIEVPATYIY